MSRSESRVGAACALVGSVLLLVGTALHPLGADPNEAAAAFTEYAADRLWITSHLTQLAGVVLMGTALLSLAQQLEAGHGAAWARIGLAGAIASITLAAALQAVDGIALKAAVDAWALAPAAQQDAAFHAAFAIRQVEIGLASLLGLFFGLTMTVYGAALLAARTYPQWLGGLALLGGAVTAVAGITMAYSGFSGLAMAINTPGSSLLLVWMLALGACMWRRGGASSTETTGKQPAGDRGPPHSSDSAVKSRML